MRHFLVLISFLAACEKSNPNLCCTDEADCSAVGLEAIRPCADEKVCRGNVCVIEQCNTPAECDVSAPYCQEGSCRESCSDDNQCPGSGQQASSRFCEGGTCVACRVNSDCAADVPVCEMGTCERCDDHADCASGVCTSDGRCAEASDVAYVAATGSSSAECTESTPCSTIEHAMSLLPARTYILLETGTYTRPGSLTIRDRRYIIGRGNPRPIITRSDSGAIVLALGSADIHFERLQISGAIQTPGNDANALDGYAVYCQVSAGTPTLLFRDVTITNNNRGIGARECRLDVQRSHFVNQDYALDTTDVIATIDRNLFESSYTSLDGGIYKFVNNIVARTSAGFDFYSGQAGNVVEFNTFVDTSFRCNLLVPQSFPNNIFARAPDPAAMNCSYPNSIVEPTNIGALQFVRPDGAPYDYHLQPGSSAIDAAGASTIDHDFDGDARPKGAGRDVGADEAQ